MRWAWLVAACAAAAGGAPREKYAVAVLLTTKPSGKADGWKPRSVKAAPRAGGGPLGDACAAGPTLCAVLVLRRTVAMNGRVPDAGKVVQAFSQGSNETRPVLLATSLVENGLDLPRCNTIVVQDAHMFGLASLHQLRGRVGRGSVPAVAVFLHPADSERTLAAGARLRAVADADASTFSATAKQYSTSRECDAYASLLAAAKKRDAAKELADVVGRTPEAETQRWIGRIGALCRLEQTPSSPLKQLHHKS